MVKKEELEGKLPEMGTYAESELEDIPVPVQLRSHLIDWEWYLYEAEKGTGIFMAYVKGFENEIGTVSIDQLNEFGCFIVHNYKATTLKELTGW